MQPGDDDYYRFGIETEADVEFTVKFDHAEGDLDIELYDGAGNWLDSSNDCFWRRDYLCRRYGLRESTSYAFTAIMDAVSSSYSVEADVTLQDNHLYA